MLIYDKCCVHKIRYGSNHLLRMVLEPKYLAFRFGDCTPLAHPLTFGNYLNPYGFSRGLKHLKPSKVCRNQRQHHGIPMFSVFLARISMSYAVIGLRPYTPWHCNQPREADWEGRQVSNEKRAPSCLGYIGDYTIQLYGDFNKP